MHLSFSVNKMAVLSHPQEVLCKQSHLLSREGEWAALVPGGLTGTKELSVLARAWSRVSWGGQAFWVAVSGAILNSHAGQRWSHRVQCVVQDLERD